MLKFLMNKKVILMFVLFVLLQPGRVVTLPPDASPMVQSVVHGLVFVLATYFVGRMI